MRTHIAGFGLTLALLAGCAMPRTEPMTFPAADADAIRAAATRYIQTVRDTAWDAWADLYTSDAVFMPPNHPSVQGRQAMMDFIKTFPPLSSFNLEPLEVDGRGDIAFVHGHFSLVMAPPGGPELADNGKYLEVWRKQTDGSWKIYRDIFNSDVPMAPEK